MPRKVLIRHSAPLPEWLEADEAAWRNANAHLMPDAPKGIKRTKNAGGASEHDEQAVLIRWKHRNLMQFPQLRMLWAVPNGGLRDMLVGVKLKQEGVTKGVLDLMLMVPSGGWHSLWLEMKVGDNAPQRSQKEIMADLHQYGHLPITCWSADEAATVIVLYLSGEIPISGDYTIPIKASDVIRQSGKISNENKLI